MSTQPNKITISEFKATCLRVLDQVKCTGTPVLVTRRGEPVALVVPPLPPDPEPSWLGAFSDTASIVGDIRSARRR